MVIFFYIKLFVSFPVKGSSAKRIQHQPSLKKFAQKSVLEFLKGSYEKTNISAVTKSTATTVTHMMPITAKKAKPFIQGM